MEGAQNALKKLRTQILSLKSQSARTKLSEEKLEKVNDFRERFLNTINDDLNTPQAIAVLWEVLKSNIPSEDKYDLALSFDEVFGLGLADVKEETTPEKVQEMATKREELRSAGNFEKADEIRKRIEELGYEIKDNEEGVEIKKR